jgi:integrase
VGHDPDIFETFHDQLRGSLEVGRRDFVFFHRDGEPRPLRGLHQYAWQPALRRAHLRYRVSYATRHTFVSHALMQGEPISWIAHVCGTSINMIDRHYAKWIPKDLGYVRQVTAALFGNELGRIEGRNKGVVEKKPARSASPTGFEPVLPT